MNLELDVQEVKAILQVLGQLPTSSGAFPLMVKIKKQLKTVPEESKEAA